MPRLPLTVDARSLRAVLNVKFCLKSIVSAVPVAAAMLLLSPAHVHADAPTGPSDAIITLSADEGMAPFTAHAHALRSQIGAGDELTARFEWDFGDERGTHNELAGWNAAHTYDRAGQYTIRLRMTDELGRKSTAIERVTVRADERQTIHVSERGHDSNPGTRSAPLRTAARGLHMLGHNSRLRFERGGRHNLNAGVMIDRRNIVIDAYGDGADPVLHWQGPAGPYGMIDLGGNCENITLEDLRFTTRHPAAGNVVRAIRPNGRNVTIRRCRFDDIGYALNSELIVNDLFAENNRTGVIGAYFAWAVGTDHVYLGNDVAGSVDEHNIRLGGCERVLICDNDLTNVGKSTIWAMLGKHCYIAGNTLRRGRLIIGPNYAVGAPDERFRFVVAESNRIVDEGVVVYCGAEQIMLRNNIVKHDGAEAFSIWGHYPPMHRTCRHVFILNNTAINTANAYGKFLKIGAGAIDLDVENNLYCAPNLNTSYGASNVHTDDPNLDTHRFRDNLWASPAQGSDCHCLSTGGIRAARWNSFSETRHERYRNFTGNELDDDYRPRFNPGEGSDAPGIQVDFYGKKRNPHAPTIGAVE